MDERSRLSRLLLELRELGVGELFLDGLTAEEAYGLLKSGPRREPVRGRVSEPGAFPGPPGHPGDGPPGGGDVRTGSAPAAVGSRGTALEVLQAEASGCLKCGLSEGRTQVVFGRGSATARLVVVGEAPGSEEDRTGLPFVGPAGKLLDLLLLSVGFDRESVYICNVLKCRPPGNRDPRPEEVASCAQYLHGQLDAIQPSALLAVGKFAAQTLTGTESSIGRLRGRIHEYRGIPVVATYHPAYLLRSPEATRKTWQDLQLMRQVMDEHD